MVTSRYSATISFLFTRYSQYGRFMLAGLLNTAIDLVALNLLLWIWPSTSLWRLLFYNMLAYAAGMLCSFHVHKRWTFATRTATTMRQVMRFSCVMGLSFLCTNVILGLAIYCLSLYALTDPFWLNLARLASLGGAAVLSFTGMSTWAFRQRSCALALQPPVSPRLLMVPPGISVFVYASEQAAKVREALVAICKTLGSWEVDFELFVLAQEDQAQMAEIVASFAQQTKHVHLIYLAQMQDREMALRAASKELTLVMDICSSSHLAELVRFLPLIEEHEAVLGYRSPHTWRCGLVLRIWRQLIYLMFGMVVKDIKCPFKLFRTEALQAQSCQASAAIGDLEILYKLCRAGGTYTEVALCQLPAESRESQHINPFKLLRELYEMLGYAYRCYEAEHCLPPAPARPVLTTAFLSPKQRQKSKKDPIFLSPSAHSLQTALPHSQH
ncbi:GtrA family protein [Ktedonosporobacter rubrisoli]|nr:GtrA family protein [Ktedonosporobacter rubrisoli]